MSPSFPTRKNIASALSLAVCLITCVNYGPVYAITQNDLNSITNNTPFFDPTATQDSCTTGGSDTDSVPTQSPSAIQQANAAIIIGIAKTDNLGQQGALIGLMVGLDESGLRVLANTNVPLSETNPNKQGDGSDHDSLGVFQQRISTNWSTISTDPNNAAAVNQLMTAAYNAEAFFGSPPGSNAPSALRKGLQDVSGWQSLEPWVAAQSVQISGDPSGLNYKKELAQAQNLVNLYYDSSPAIPLPVAVTGGSASGGFGSDCALPASGFSGDEHVLAQQILADPNITYDYGQDGIVIGPFKDLASGKEADTLPNSGSTNVSTTLLKFILTLAQSHKVNISAFTTQHPPGDVHTLGDAVDINILDGTHLVGRDPGALAIISLAVTVLPPGSGFGQQECPGTPISTPGFMQFNDTCTHLHVQVPEGTP